MNLKNSNLTHQFSVQLSSTRRGARLARLLATEQIRSWGLPHEAAAQVIAELASNAATHGRAPGRDFRIVLTLPAPGTLRIEVTDTRPERLPTTPRNAALDEEWGRGLVLVNALSTRWGAITGPPPCKTVWAELDLTPRLSHVEDARHWDEESFARRHASEKGMEVEGSFDPRSLLAAVEIVSRSNPDNDGSARCGTTRCWESPCT